MITSVVNTTAYVPFTLLDSMGSPETGKVNGDFSASAFLASTPATTATVTVTEVSGGRYVLSFAPSSVGTWFVTWSVSVDGETVPYEETVQVVTASQDDPVAAIASTVAAVNTLSTRLTDARAAKLDRIGTAGATLTAPSSPSSNAISIRRGNDYTAGSPHGPFEWNEDAWSAYGLDGETVTVTWRLLTAGDVVLSKAVSVVDAETIRLELTDSETAQLRFGVYPFDILAEIGSDTATLVTGTATVP